MSTPSDTEHTTHPESEGREGRPPIAFTVDGEPLTTSDPTLTPRQIMTLAGVDPDANYLVEVKGRHQTSYRDRPDIEIRVQKGDAFITISTGPTPVS
jgi:hypothetical protein